MGNHPPLQEPAEYSPYTFLPLPGQRRVTPIVQNKHSTLMELLCESLPPSVLEICQVERQSLLDGLDGQSQGRVCLHEKCGQLS